MNHKEQECDPLLRNANLASRSEGHAHTEYRVYTRRWYMLTVLCLLNFSSALIWMSFASVADYTAVYYKRTLKDINWLSLVFLFGCLMFSLGASWVLDTLGLRTGIITGAWFTAVGAGVRMLSGFSFVPTSYKFAVLITGQSMAALAQPFILNSPTKLAALWFNANERTKANMFTTLSNSFGILIANAAAPLIIGTNADNMPFMVQIFAIPSFFAVVMATCGFCSSTPPTPPTASAAFKVQPFFRGLKMVLTNKSYLILMMAFGFALGLFACITTLLQQILCPHGYNDTMAGTSGAVLIGAGLFGGAIAGWYVDKTKEFEFTAKVSYGMVAILVCFFTLISSEPNQSVAVLIACGMYGFFSVALMPVCFELGVECCYPVAQSTSAGLQWMFGQVTAIVLILVCQELAQPKSNKDLPHDVKCSKSVEKDNVVQDLTWSTYLLSITVVIVAVMFIILFKPRYHRLIAEQQECTK